MPDPTLVYTPKSHLSRDSMVHLIEAGQTVLVPGKVQVDGQGVRTWAPGRLVRRVEDLPTEAELAEEDPEAQAQLARRLQAQIRAAQAQLAELPIPGARDAGRESAPPEPESDSAGMIPEAEARAIFDEQHDNHRRETEAMRARIAELEAQVKATPAGKDDRPPSVISGPPGDQPLPPADPTPLPIPDPPADEMGKPGKSDRKSR